EARYIVPMMPRLNGLPRQLFTAVLTCLVLTSAGGFSFADAVLYHSTGVPSVAELRHHGVHVEPLGQSAHSDRCVLGSALCGPRTLEQPRAALLRLAPANLEQRFRSQQTLTPSEKQFVAQPRAPPRHPA